MNFGTTSLLAADTRPEGELLSVYGTLFLTGAMAAARAEDRGTVRDFLTEADTAARTLGTDDRAPALAGVRDRTLRNLPPRSGTHAAGWGTPEIIRG